MPKLENTYIAIVMDSYTHVMREADPDAQWDGDDTDTDTTIRGFEVVSQGRGWDFVVKGRNAAQYTLVTVIYATGDSFSRHSGRVSHVELCVDHTEAQKLEHAIMKHTGESSFPFTKSDGTKLTIDCSPWTGYFEHIEDIRLTTVDEL